MREPQGDGFQVQPQQLLAAAARIRLVVAQFGPSRRDAVWALDDVERPLAGSLTAQAAAELAAAVTSVVAGLGSATADLAGALQAAAERYLAADTLR